jgi:hypothetical protein
VTARFGRNKRRAAREALEKANAALEARTRELGWAQARIADERREAVARVLNQPEKIAAAMDRITRELAHALPPELAPHAEKLLNADQRRRPPIAFDASIRMDDTFQVVVVEGRIDLRFAMKVAQY